MNLQIRQAEISDIEILSPLFCAYRAFYKCDPAADETRKFLAKNLAEKRSIIFVAINEQGQMVAFTQLYQWLSSLSMAHYIYLSDLYVDEAFRKQGIAKLLMEKAEEHGRAIGAIKIQLETAHTNVQAQGLYQSLGYQWEQEYRTYVLKLPKRFRFLLF